MAVLAAATRCGDGLICERTLGCGGYTNVLKFGGAGRERGGREVDEGFTVGTHGGPARRRRRIVSNVKGVVIRGRGIYGRGDADAWLGGERRRGLV